MLLLFSPVFTRKCFTTLLKQIHFYQQSNQVVQRSNAAGLKRIQDQLLTTALKQTDRGQGGNELE